MKLPVRLPVAMAVGAIFAISSFGFVSGVMSRQGTSVAADNFITGSNSVPETRMIAGLGIVESAGGSVELSALMPGVIVKLHKDEGDAVKRGEIIAELANEDLKALLAQAQSSLELEAARLALVENGPRTEDISRAATLVQEEQGNIKLYDKQVRRRTALVAEGAIAREALDEAVRALANSKQRKNAAENQLKILRKGARPEELEAARAAVAVAEQRVEEAKALLNKSFVKSPIDGIVLRKYLQAGEAISMDPGRAIVQIADISKLVVRTQIDESDIGGLVEGLTARITAPALNGKQVTGKIVRISPRLGAKTITAEAAGEKRDTRVLEVTVALEPLVRLPINLRVDVLIDFEKQTTNPDVRGSLVEIPGTSG